MTMTARELCAWLVGHGWTTTVVDEATVEGRKDGKQGRWTLRNDRRDGTIGRDYWRYTRVKRRAS